MDAPESPGVATPESNQLQKQVLIERRTSKLRCAYRILLGTVIAVGAAATYTRNHMFPDGTPALEEKAQHSSLPREYFKTALDGDILGKTLIFVDEETGKETTAKFFLSGNRLSLEINGRKLSNTDTIDLPEGLLKAFHLPDNPLLLVKGLEKRGNHMYFILSIRDSECIVEPAAIVLIAKGLENDPESPTLSIGLPYTLRGHICNLPGVPSHGTQQVHFQVERTGAPAQQLISRK